MNIHLADPGECFCKDSDTAKARKQWQQKEISKISAQIENSYLKDFVKKMQIMFDPVNQYEEDREWYEIAKLMGVYSHLSSDADRCPFVLRYELSLRKLIEKEEILTVKRIAEKIEQQLRKKKLTHTSTTTAD